MKKIIYLALLLLISPVVLPSNAMAKSIFEHQSTTVPANQTVDDVVIVGGDAAVLGTVNSSVIVVNGNAYIKSTAHINGLVLVIGGKIEQDPGAVITDEVINISFDHATANSLLIGGGLVLGLWVIQFIGSLILLLIPMLMIVLGKNRMESFVKKYDVQSIWRLISTGFLMGLILAAASLLLLLTIIGIPLILVIGLIVLVSLVFGITAISYHLGVRIQGFSGKSAWVKATAGAFVITAVLNIPFIGVLIFFMLLLFSLGITTNWAVNKTRSKNTNK